MASTLNITAKDSSGNSLNVAVTVDGTTYNNSTGISIASGQKHNIKVVAGSNYYVWEREILFPVDDRTYDFPITFYQIGENIIQCEFTTIEYKCSTNVAAIYLPAGPYSSIKWYWGDGHVGSGLVAYHTYESYGVFKVKLEVELCVGEEETIETDCGSSDNEDSTACELVIIPDTLTAYGPNDEDDIYYYYPDSEEKAITTLHTDWTGFGGIWNNSINLVTNDNSVADTWNNNNIGFSPNEIFVIYNDSVKVKVPNNAATSPNNNLPLPDDYNDFIQYGTSYRLSIPSGVDVYFQFQLDFAFSICDINNIVDIEIQNSANGFPVYYYSDAYRYRPFISGLTSPTINNWVEMVNIFFFGKDTSLNNLGKTSIYLNFNPYQNILTYIQQNKPNTKFHYVGVFIPIKLIFSTTIHHRAFIFGFEVIHE